MCVYYAGKGRNTDEEDPMEKLTKAETQECHCTSPFCATREQTPNPPTREYIHPTANCKNDSTTQTVIAADVALGAGPICDRCGVRYWTKPW